MIIVGQKDRVMRWVVDRVTGTLFHDYEAIGIERGGELIGGVIVHDYVPNARCSMTCAGDGGSWLNRHFLPFLFHYVFEQLQCNVVIISIDSKNDKSLRLMKHIGFSECCTVKNGGVDSDLVILEMQKTSCKYLQRREALGVNQHGQASESTAST